MDDFARGELLWARRRVEEKCGLCICHALMLGLSTNMPAINYLDCFSELGALWDGVVYRDEDSVGSIKRVPGGYTQAYKNSFWWPLNRDGQSMRIEAIDFLLTKRQGATYARHPDA